MKTQQAFQPTVHLRRCHGYPISGSDAIGQFVLLHRNQRFKRRRAKLVGNSQVFAETLVEPDEVDHIAARVNSILDAHCRLASGCHVCLVERVAWDNQDQREEHQRANDEWPRP